MGFSEFARLPDDRRRIRPTNNGGFDVTLTKVNAVRIGLVFSTVLGGLGSDTGGGLAVNDAGEAYVWAVAPDPWTFRRRPARYTRRRTAAMHFVTSSTPPVGDSSMSTVVGGIGSEGASGSRPRCGGQCLDHGQTSSRTFRRRPMPPADLNGGADAFISELNADGSALRLLDVAGRLAVGQRLRRGGRCHRRRLRHGPTFSLDYPATVGAFDTVWARRPLDLLGRRVRDEDRRQRDHQRAGRAAGDAGHAEPGRAANGDTPPQPITLQLEPQ